MTDSIVRALLQYIDSRIAMAEPMEAPLFYEDSSELDPTTRTLLNPEGKTTNIDKEDTIMQPKTNDDPNLTVTFSDEEDDEASKVPPMQQHDILPVPKYLIYVRHETNYGFHDYIPLESTVYDIKDVKISIKGPIHLAAITDHPSYYFLIQVKEELNRLDDKIKSSKYLCPTGIAEIRFDFGLLATKILHYASHYGHSTSPSWTLAKDVPDGTISAMRNAGDSAHLLSPLSALHNSSSWVQTQTRAPTFTQATSRPSEMISCSLTASTTRPWTTGNASSMLHTTTMVPRANAAALETTNLQTTSLSVTLRPRLSIAPDN